MPQMLMFELILHLTQNIFPSVSVYLEKSEVKKKKLVPAVLLHCCYMLYFHLSIVIIPSAFNYMIKYFVALKMCGCL